MKSKIITGSGSVIALLYTFLMIFAVGGFDRAGVVNSTVDFFGFENVNVYGVLLFIFCVIVLVLYYIVISKSKNNVVGVALIISFIIGAVLLILVVKVTSVQKCLFDFYISWFYHGVHYEGEDKVPQVFSFISRLIAFCFFFGSIISLFIVKSINRSLIKT